MTFYGVAEVLWGVGIVGVEVFYSAHYRRLIILKIRKYTYGEPNKCRAFKSQFLWKQYFETASKRKINIIWNCLWWSPIGRGLAIARCEDTQDEQGSIRIIEGYPRTVRG